MVVHTRTMDGGRVTEFTISGALDDASVREVLTQYRRLPQVCWEHLEVRFVSTNRLDLEGLELLLLLRERSRERQSVITLVNCTREVRRLLERSGMHHHFLICDDPACAL